VDFSKIRHLKERFQSDEHAHKYAVTSPDWSSDIKWISPNTIDEFKLFDRLFRDLGVADAVREYVDFEKEIRFFAGYFVTRSICEKADFHLDWFDANNEGFTLITPLTSNAGDHGLLYERKDGSIGEYRYEIGQAILFGDHFIHSTKPGKSDAPIVLFSMTFGTDKNEHLEKVSRSIFYAANIVRLPNGHFFVHDFDETL
jgi:hypothetical protein